MKKKSILVISFSFLKIDARVSRQLTFLRDQGFEVTAVGCQSPELKGVRFLSSESGSSPRFRKVKKLIKLLFKKYDSIYWDKPSIKHTYNLLHDTPFDLYLANDIDALPLILRLANENDGKVLFDAHEYAPREFEDRLRWRLFSKKYLEYLCKKYIPKAHAMTTVCEGIAMEYSRHFLVNPTVITNAPPRYQLTPTPVQKERIRMIYHSIANPSRSIEDVIKIMGHVDERFTLDMILLPGEQEYMNHIKMMAQKNQKIRFIPPVSMPQIPHLCHQYDIGFFPLRPTNLNYYYALPNKFFEFIQSRVALAISPLPEMSQIVNKYSCGIIAPDFEPRSFAQKLNELSAQQIWEMKQNTGKAANQLCAEENNKTFQRIINQLLTC